MNLNQALNRCRLIAILRGLPPEEAERVAGTLIEAGISIIEIPLNSPNPFHSIEKIAKIFCDQAIVGAGTVLKLADCERLSDVGGRLVVSPNCNPKVIEKSKALGLYAFPGVATPTEAFTALDAKADGIKLFPFENLGGAALNAWHAVLPPETVTIPVGGICPDDIAPLAALGAQGFGIGSALYKPDMSTNDIAIQAQEFVASERAAFARRVN